MHAGQAAGRSKRPGERVEERLIVIYMLQERRFHVRGKLSSGKCLGGQTGFPGRSARARGFINLRSNLTETKMVGRRRLGDTFLDLLSLALNLGK